MRLGVLSRFGIIASVIWSIGCTGWYGWTTLGYRANNWSIMYESCVSGLRDKEHDVEQKLTDDDYKSCNRAADSMSKGDTDGVILAAGFILSLVGTLAAWIVGLTIYWSLRWIVAGKKRPQADTQGLGQFSPPG